MADGGIPKLRLKGQKWRPGPPILLTQTAPGVFPPAGSDRALDAPLQKPLLVTLARSAKKGLPLFVQQTSSVVFAPEGSDRAVDAPLTHPLLIRLESMRRVPLLQATQVQASAVGGSGTPEIVAVGISTAEALGQPVASAVVGAAGIAGAEAVGQPDAQSTIGAIGIASSEEIGQPVIPGGQIPVVAGGGGATRPVFYTQKPPLHRIDRAGGIAGAEWFGRPVISSQRSVRRRREEEAALLAA